jgi:cytochrome oxidase Cu insertion factor (SCO1/SenC/PrrC family)
MNGDASPAELDPRCVVSGADHFRGRVVLLSFGYTNCPDLCLLTLMNVAAVLKRLRPDAQRVRVLFVSPAATTPATR